MASHKLLLLPGDGIGPEVMAEVKRLIDWLNAQGIAHFETEQGLVGGAAYDASKQSIADDTMAKADDADAGATAAARGRVVAAAQGTRPVRQFAPRGLLSRARRCIQPQTRGGRGPRHHDRAR